MDHVFPGAFRRGGRRQPGQVHLREPRKGGRSCHGAAQEDDDCNPASARLLDGKDNLWQKVLGGRQVGAPLGKGRWAVYYFLYRILGPRCCVWGACRVFQSSA